MTPHRALKDLALPPRFRTIDGLSIRFAESEPGSVDALLLNPWPESVFAYEPIWLRLAAHAHLVAIDLPGFGRSEGRDALMSPQAMGEFIVRAADAFGLERPHVIGPDIGTSATLFAAARHPDRLLSLVVGSGGTVFPLQINGVLLEWIVAPDLDPYRRIDGREIVDGVVKTLERYTISEAAREDYLSSYEGARFAESMRYVRAYPQDLPVLRDVLPRIQTPVQIVAGRRDPVIPLVNAEYLHQWLPQSELHVVDAGHFTWEDDADEYAALVARWWAGGFAAAGSPMARSIGA